MADCEKPSGCLLESVHRRMSDSHTLWHCCLDEYFDPDKFRVALQSCIPTLRSVTFLLQKQKQSIPDFEHWYSSWQQRMRADNVMRWLVDSRNTIEKEGDLETYSTVTAQLIAGYTDTFPVLEIKGSLFEQVESLLSRVPKLLLENRILEHGVLKIERRWVANSLPDIEILDAIAEVYGKISLVVDDAHRQIGLPVPFLIHPHPEKIIPVAGGGPAGGRLPCMIGHDDRRSTLVSLKTGAHIEIVKQSIDAAQAERVARQSYQHLAFPDCHRRSKSAHNRRLFSAAQKRIYEAHPVAMRLS